MIDIHARGNRDHPGQASADRPVGIAPRHDERPHCPSGEAHRHGERQRAQRHRSPVDAPPRLGICPHFGDPEHGTRGIEGVEAGEDQHQPQHGHRQVVRRDRLGPTLLVVLAETGTQVQQHPEREGGRHRVHTAPGTPVVETVLRVQPRPITPAPRRGQDPDDRAQDHRQQQVRTQPDPLDHRSGHDRGGGKTEQQKRKPEYPGDVVAQVRAHRFAPGQCRRRRLGADRDQTALKGIVDPPAEQEERGSDHRAGEQVLHHRHQHVLLTRHARLVDHEPGVDQPHQHPGPEIRRLDRLLGKQPRVAFHVSAPTQTVATPGVRCPSERHRAYHRHRHAHQHHDTCRLVHASGVR